MINKVIVVTSIEPDKMNLGGGPSGLIWEIINEYKKHNIAVDVLVIPETTNRFRRVLHRYGIYLKRISGFEKYDRVVVYPENLAMAISAKFRNKMVVLGPDSPSLRDSRIYKFMHKGVFKYVKLLYRYISCLHEYRVARCVKRFIVVGRVDQLWMKRNFFIRHDNKCYNSIYFLHHPLLSNVIKNDVKYRPCNNNRTFVFSGDLSYLHNYQFIECVIAEIRKRNMDVNKRSILNFIVVGKKNKWISEQLNEVPDCYTEYIRWVADYNDVCIPGKHIHCIPILVGAGTKNRTLTALANGLEIITTPVGIENIPWQGLTGCCITRNPIKFVECIFKLNQCNFDKRQYHFIESEREIFRQNVTELFKRDFVKYFLE